jgi:hypothetical protein
MRSDEMNIYLVRIDGIPTYIGTPDELSEALGAGYVHHNVANETVEFYDREPASPHREEWGWPLAVAVPAQRIDGYEVPLIPESRMIAYRSFRYMDRDQYYFYIDDE